jgi:hypothetical protein
MNIFKPTANTIHYGFKRITATNVTELDDKPKHLFRRQANGKKWVDACMKPQLDPSVPDEVAFLYEVARGSMVYGMYFQPLASLAMEQMYRVLEAGARRRCDQLELIKKKPGKGKVLPDTPFAAIVAALNKAGKIPDAELHQWEGWVLLRNYYSHPASQVIQSADSPPRQAAQIAELLNRLFK